MSRGELTFNIVDDLAEGHLRGNLTAPPSGQTFVPVGLGPLMELALQSSSGRVGPLLSSAWLDRAGHTDLRLVLASPVNSWFDNARDTGIQRTTFNPLDEKADAVRTGFLVAASLAAQRAGFPRETAQSLVAAIREMESNVHEHSELTETGILAFHASAGIFEFIVADCGVGVLATLRESSDYADLQDHGLALQEVLKPGVSRYGRAANRGNGFRDLFIGLASLNADLRFRSGDHALTISGPHPELKTARLAQKPFFQGFAASVRCALPQVPHTLH
ncbi:MAG TPA: hypothetical protein VHM90_13070 [Phycisphaerae bacterium]|nr:hypothetical protein [Phycisphaerae bacterium]